MTPGRQDDNKHREHEQGNLATKTTDTAIRRALVESRQDMSALVPPACVTASKPRRRCNAFRCATGTRVRFTRCPQGAGIGLAAFWHTIVGHLRLRH